MNGFAWCLGDVALTQYLLAVLGVSMLAVPKGIAGEGTMLVFLANSVLALYAVITHAEGMLLPLMVVTTASLVGCWLCFGKPRLAAYRARIHEQWTGGHV